MRVLWEVQKVQEQGMNADLPAPTSTSTLWSFRLCLAPFHISFMPPFPLDPFAPLTWLLLSTLRISSSISFSFFLFSAPWSKQAQPRAQHHSRRGSLSIAVKRQQALQPVLVPAQHPRPLHCHYQFQQAP